MSDGSVEPSVRQLAALEALRAAGTRPVTMLNLLRYRRQADYGPHPDEKPCSGREAYARYAALVAPCLESVGARVVFSGVVHSTVIGPPSERWDDMLLVEYPSVEAFLQMLGSQAYRAIGHHRTAALADSRLVPISAGEPGFRRS